MLNPILAHMIVGHQMDERLEEARRERLANAVNRNSFIRDLVIQAASRLLRRDATPTNETITPELPASQASASSS